MKKAANERKKELKEMGGEVHGEIRPDDYKSEEEEEEDVPKVFT